MYVALFFYLAQGKVKYSELKGSKNWPLMTVISICYVIEKCFYFYIF